MQTQGGAEADAAIVSSECRMVARIWVDWFKNGTVSGAYGDISEFVDNIVLDKSLAGAQPSEIMLIEGASAAELTFDISGDAIDNSVSWVSALSPYNGLSPFYGVDVLGAEVTYAIGVETSIGIIWYQQFIGNIRSIAPDRAADKVEIKVLDRVEKLRRPIPFTNWGLMDLQAGKGEVQSQLMYADWVIDHCLKAGRVSSSPYRWAEPEQMAHGQAQIWISGNGAVVPNIGWVDGSWQNDYAVDGSGWEVYHPNGQVHPASPETSKKPQMFRSQQNHGYDQNLFWANDRDAVNAARTHVIAFTLHTENLYGSRYFNSLVNEVVFEWAPHQHCTMQVMVSAGQMWLRCIQDTETPTTFNTTKVNIPLTNPYYRVQAHWDTVGQQTWFVFDNGTAGNSGVQSTGFSNIGWGFHESTGVFKIYRSISTQDIAVGTHTLGLISTPGEAGVSAEYAAVLDRSVNRLSFLPDRRGALAWDVITEVAAAEFGAVFWDENGVFHFWNQDTILSKKDTVVRQFTLDDVGTLNIQYSKDSVRNIASVTSKKARAQNVTVWEAQGPDEYVARNTGFSDNVTVMYIDNVITPGSARPPIYAHPDQTGSAALDAYPHWSDTVRHGVVVQHYDAATPGWKNYSWTLPQDTFGLYLYRGPNGECIMRYNNGYTTDHRFAVSQSWDNLAIPEGTSSAAIRWDGSKLNFFDDLTFQVRNDDSIAKYGAQGLELSGDWYQEFYNYAGLIDTLLARTAEPIPVTDNITIAGDPRLQLGDTIEVYDPEGLGETLRFQILGINRTLSRDDGLVDELTVELVRPANIGIWDSPQYGLWDSTFVWSA